jgi:hypothetical protein
MATLVELVADRCAAVAEFKANIYGHRDQEISSLNEAIQKATVTTKEDALAALHLISVEAADPEQPLILAMVSALGRYLEGTASGAADKKPSPSMGN